MLKKRSVTIATNNGDIGGGEVMLFNIARQLRSLHCDVTIVGPKHPAEVVEAAADEGFDVVSLPARNRKQYMAQLRMWDRQHRQDLLWCNGLVPSVATTGHTNRIVHLHQIPSGKLKVLARLAMKNALRCLIPSKFGAERITGTEVFYNWSNDLNMPLQRKQLSNPLKVGFIGRPSSLKGTDDLADALSLLNLEGGEYELLIGGEAKFVESQDREYVEKKLEALGACVHQLGWVEPAAFFQQIDVLVVPSIAEESFGLVLVEAMSARLPVIISDAGALPEIAGSHYPWVYPRGNVTELAQKIAEVGENLRRHSDLLETTLSDAYWRWHENFSSNAGKTRIEDLLISLGER